MPLYRVVVFNSDTGERQVRNCLGATFADAQERALLVSFRKRHWRRAVAQAQVPASAWCERDRFHSEHATQQWARYRMVG